MDKAYLIFGLAVAAILGFMTWQYPYILGREGMIGSLAYMALLVMFLGPSALRRYSGNAGQMFQHMLIWVVLVLVLVGGYAYRHELMQTRLAAALIPQHARIQADGTVEFYASDNGHFHIVAEIGDVPVEFLADTGASDIVLSPSDARRIGLDPERLDYTRVYSTANGMGSGAPVRLPVFRVGSIVLYDIEASVNDAEMDSSLLGMRFFSRLRGFSVENDRMILRP